MAVLNAAQIFCEVCESDQEPIVGMAYYANNPAGQASAFSLCDGCVEGAHDQNREEPGKIVLQQYTTIRLHRPHGLPTLTICENAPDLVADSVWEYMLANCQADGELIQYGAIDQVAWLSALVPDTYDGDDLDPERTVPVVTNGVELNRFNR